MSTHQGLPVAGYQPQSEDRVAVVNANKKSEERILRLLDEMAASKELCDPRWVAIGRTHIELAFMAINRAVFQPSRVALPEDEPIEESAHG